MSKPGAALAHADGDARTRVRWSSRRPFRRFAAILTSLALGAGLAVVGVAAPASAHHNTIEGFAACSTDGKSVDITWTVENSEDDRVENITASSNTAVVPIATQLAPSETKSFIQQGVALGKKYELKLSAEWYNSKGQVTATSTDKSEKVDVPSDLCSDSGKKVTICHATESAKNPYVRITVSMDSVQERHGHRTHHDGRDIIPAFTYKGTNYPAQGDQSRLTTGDCSAVTTIPVPAQPEKQDLCGTADDKVLLPADSTTVKWSATPVTGGQATAVASVQRGYKFEDGSTSKTFQFTFGTEPCPVEVPLPAKPAMVEACGVVGDAVVEPKKINGVTWVISPIVGGKATATATTTDGYVFADGTTSKTWDFTFNSEPCLLPAPVEPEFIEQCGLAGDAVEFPAAVDHVTWTTVGDPKAGGLVTVTAVAAEGYSFPADAETSFTHTFTDEPCPPTIITFEGAPTKSDVCGADDDAVVLPAEGAHMSWQVDGDPKKGGLVTVTAVADKGYAFGEGVQTVFPMTFDSADCPTEIPAPPAPTSIDVCGVDKDKVNLPDNSTQVVWTTTGTPGAGPVIVTATAQDGFDFPGDVKTITFKFEFADTKCIEPTLTGSVATGTCIADSPWITFDVELTDPDKQSTGNTASLVMTDGTNSTTIELGELKDGSLEGKVLWPGASVDENGTANGWPGWALVGNKWIEVQDNFAWTRGVITAEIVVNPALDVTIAYPAAAPNCAIGPKTTPPGGGEGSTPAASDGTGLASTGFAGTTIAIVAGIIVIAGVAFLVVARIRRKRA